MATNIITERAPPPPPVTHSHQGVTLGPGLDKTALMMLPRKDAADAAMLALFQLQDLSSEEQVMGAAVLFATLCSSLRLDPEEMHAVGLRVLKAPVEGDHVTANSLQILRDMVALRIEGRDTTAW